MNEKPPEEEYSEEMDPVNLERKRERRIFGDVFEKRDFIDSVLKHLRRLKRFEDASDIWDRIAEQGDKIIKNNERYNRYKLFRILANSDTLPHQSPIEKDFPGDESVVKFIDELYAELKEKYGDELKSSKISKNLTVCILP